VLLELFSVVDNIKSTMSPMGVVDRARAKFESNLDSDYEQEG
jgi:hypothetical protein